MVFSQETSGFAQGRCSINVYWIEDVLYLRFSLLKNWIPDQWIVASIDKNKNTNSLKIFRPKGSRMDLRETVSQWGQEQGVVGAHFRVMLSQHLSQLTAQSVSWEIRPMGGAFSVPLPLLSRLSRTTFPGMQCGARRTAHEKDSATQRA